MDETATLRSPTRIADARIPASEVRPAEPGVAEFDALVATHRDQVARLIARLVDRREDVEDLVQETFLAALAHSERFRGECRPGTWLARIAVNRCRSHHRWRRVRRLIRLSRNHDGENHTATNAHRAIEAGEEVRRAVGCLPDKWREVVVLRYFEDLPLDEMAEVLNLSRPAVEKRLSRARGRLKEILTPRL